MFNIYFLKIINLKYNIVLNYMLKFLVKILAFTSFFYSTNAFVQNVPLIYTKSSIISRNNNNNFMIINQECPEYLSI